MTILKIIEILFLVINLMWLVFMIRHQRENS